jgi:hypothetical protein
MNLKNTKECKVYFTKLEKIRNTVEEKVKKMEIIPDKLMNEYKSEYENFSKCYFSKKIRIPGIKENILRTLEQIINYKEKINKIPKIIRIFLKDLVNNYLKFLDMSEMMCRDFLKKL